MVEIYRWLGRAPLNTLLEAVRPAQKTEFEKMISEREEEFQKEPAVANSCLRKDQGKTKSDQQTKYFLSFYYDTDYITTKMELFNLRRNVINIMVNIILLLLLNLISFSQFTNSLSLLLHKLLFD